MNVLSGAPLGQLTGFEDNSIRIPLPEGEKLPMHLPWLAINAERGPETTQLVGGSDATRMYGVRTFDEQGDYVNHATMMYNTINATGNVCMLRRIISEAHRKANLRLFLEIVKAKVPVYKRDAQGEYIYGQDGNKQVDADADPVDGHKLRWLVKEIPLDSKNIPEGGIRDFDAFEFGQGKKSTGSLVGIDGEESIVFPWMDFQVTHYGKYGNNIGLALSVPNVNSASPVNEAVVDENGALQWRLQFVERPDAASVGVVTQTLGGAQEIEFSLKPGAMNKALGQNIHFDKVFPKAYTDLDSKGFAPIYGPMDSYKLYQDYIAEALALLHTAEIVHNPMMDTESPYMVNPVDAVDVDAIPYYTMEVVGPEEGGILLGAGTYHYATGGSDGDQSLTAFDAGVKSIFDNWEFNDVDQFMDSAEFPMSVFYDSGFTLETKKSMLAPIGLRKDLYVVLSTQDVMQPQNSADAEYSIALALRARARLYPESAHYGTATCRAVIVGHSGTLLNSNYDGLLPLTLDFAQKCARYMGAAEGSMKEEFSMDTSPLNNVEMFRDINCVYKSPRVRQKDWTAGLVWVQRKDRSDYFYPAYQTVYDNDTSVLNSFMNMAIGVELEKVCERVWRNLTGDTKLTDGKFFEKSDKMIEAYTSGRFDGRVIVEPETYKTPEDKLRGYSWTCKINMYANNMRTVGTYTVTANRREDYEG